LSEELTANKRECMRIFVFICVHSGKTLCLYASIRGFIKHAGLAMANLLFAGKNLFASRHLQQNLLTIL